MVHLCAKKVSVSCQDRIAQDEAIGINADSFLWVCKAELSVDGGDGACCPHRASEDGELSGR